MYNFCPKSVKFLSKSYCFLIFLWIFFLVRKNSLQTCFYYFWRHPITYTAQRMSNNEYIVERIKQNMKLMQDILADSELITKTNEAADIILTALKDGKRLYFCGNGGSASDAQHLAAEFTGRFYIDREALPAEALHCNTSYLTAVANDYGYPEVYSHYIKGVGRKGDVLVGLSTSGNSTNIIEALKVAQERKLKTISFTGVGGGMMGEFSDILLDVPSEVTPRIQEAHILLGHIICEQVEKLYFQK